VFAKKKTGPRLSLVLLVSLCQLQRFHALPAVAFALLAFVCLQKKDKAASFSGVVGLALPAPAFSCAPSGGICFVSFCVFANKRQGHSRSLSFVVSLPLPRLCRASATKTDNNNP
jgi:hypothetical protein